MTISREVPQKLGIIAGNGVYPRLLADAARKAGVQAIVAAAFADETDPVLERHVDLLEWMRVGQLGRLLKFFRGQDVHHAIMAGQIAPKKLFDLRPDLKALMLLVSMLSSILRLMAVNLLWPSMETEHCWEEPDNQDWR